MLKNSILSSISGQEEKLWVNDVFSTWLYTGNGSTQTINNGIDLAGKGGLVWSKCRDAIDHALFCTALGQNIFATSQNSGIVPNIPPVISFDSNGYSWLRTLSRVNQSTTAYVSWTFRNADKFYGHKVLTKSAGSNATVNFANLGTLGMVRVKRTDSTGSWYIWHRSLSAGQLLIGETTAAAATLGHVTVSGTTVTLVNSVIADGTYLVEAFAHDSSADGIIQCGSFNTDASGNATVNIGWEPQYLLYRTPVATDDWWILDSIRGWSIGNDAYLLADTNTSEGSSFSQGNPTASGFYYQGTANRQFIYLAIRRPNKPPTTGTQVYNAIARTGTGAAATVTGVGFAPDLVIAKPRSRINVDWPIYDKLRGSLIGLRTSSSVIEVSDAASLTGFSNDGCSVGSDSSAGINGFSGDAYINYFMRRAPGFMETFAYTGNGANRTVTHGLAAVPDLLIVKSRSNATDWQVWYNGLAASEKLVLNSNAAKATDATAWNSTLPTSTNISVGTSANTNTNSATYIAYAFSSLQGIQKIGTYTGDGTSGRVIDCGFTTGARFICIKAVSTTGSWLVSDSTRGITSSSDPYLQLNSTAAEVTTEDWLDPSSSGFVVNNVSSSNANTLGVTYFYWAIS